MSQYDIDSHTGLPKEYVSCPGCGKLYRTFKKVCISCEECVKCCSCKTPHLIASHKAIEAIIENS